MKEDIKENFILWNEESVKKEKLVKKENLFQKCLTKKNGIHILNI